MGLKWEPVGALGGTFELQGGGRGLAMAIRHGLEGNLPRLGIIAEYAARYGVDGRTIKRWRKCGRIAGDKIDLSSPTAVLEWWGRNMTQRPTLGILVAAVAEGTSPEVEFLLPRRLRELPDEPPLFDMDSLAVERTSRPHRDQ